MSDIIDDIDDDESCDHDIDDNGVCEVCHEYIGWTCQRCDADGLDVTQIAENDYFGIICDDCYHSVGHGGSRYYTTGEHWL